MSWLGHHSNLPLEERNQLQEAFAYWSLVKALKWKGYWLQRFYIKVKKRQQFSAPTRLFVQKMNFCSWKGDRVCVYTRQTQWPPLGCALSSQIRRGRHITQCRRPFCKGDGDCGLLFQVSRGSGFALLLAFYALSHERKASFARWLLDFWAAVCAPGTKKRNPKGPHEDHILMGSTQSPKATLTPAKSGAEFLHPRSWSIATVTCLTVCIPAFCLFQ